MALSSLGDYLAALVCGGPPEQMAGQIACIETKGQRAAALVEAARR